MVRAKLVLLSKHFLLSASDHLIKTDSCSGVCQLPSCDKQKLGVHAQFALWYLTLVLSRRGILGVWSPSLAMPDAAAHFWLAVCTGACLVRLFHRGAKPWYRLVGHRVYVTAAT